MVTRNSVLSDAIDKCMKELYSLAVPSITWENFIKENEEYIRKEQEYDCYRKAFKSRESDPRTWEEWNVIRPDWKDKSIHECIGPRPYEFYYLPKDILKDIFDNYVHAYKIDTQKELLDTINILKDYCKSPIVDKYIDDYTDKNGLYHTGYRGYDHPDNLVKEVTKILTKYDDSMDSEQGEEIVNKFFEFLDMAGKFYNWNRDLNTFSMNVYLGASPNSNKEAVIRNWKEYRGKDIESDEKQIERNYYGEEIDD